MRRFIEAMYIAMTGKTERVGEWNGQQVIMVADGFSGFADYQYHDSVLMGEIFGKFV